MQSWSQAVTMKKEKLKHRRNLVPPRNNMTSFMENMEWDGNLGKELQGILDDYTKENDLDTALKRHKPSKIEVVKQAKKMADMRRQIANQIKEFKRIKKIKSKSFRKRLRARKAKITPSLEELQEIDPKLYKREVTKLLRQRAEERMTLRHKNTNKWAKSIIRRGKDGKIDMNSRKALMEQLERGQALKRRIAGVDSDDDDLDNHNGDKSQNNGVMNGGSLVFFFVYFYVTMMINTGCFTEFLATFCERQTLRFFHNKLILFSWFYSHGFLRIFWLLFMLEINMFLMFCVSFRSWI